MRRENIRKVNDSYFEVEKDDLNVTLKITKGEDELYSGFANFFNLIIYRIRNRPIVENT